MYYHRTGQIWAGGNTTSDDDAYALGDELLSQQNAEIVRNWSQGVIKSLESIQEPERIVGRSGQDPLFNEEFIMYNPNYPARWTIDGSGQIEQQAFTFLHQSSPKPVSVTKKPKLVILPTVITTKGPRSVSTLVSAAVEYNSDSFWDEPNTRRHDVDPEADIRDTDFGKRQLGIWSQIRVLCRRLFSLVSFINIIAAVAIIASGFPREWLETMTALNFIIAILFCQEMLVNTMYKILCGVPSSWPWWFRRFCARVHYIGQVHFSAAVAAGLWLLVNNIGDAACMAPNKCSGSWGEQSTAAQIVSWLLMTCFIAILVISFQNIRKRYHSLFDIIHRFVGWAMIALFWTQIILSVDGTKPADKSLGRALIQTPSMWFLIVSTIIAASSWLWFKKVPFQPEVLSKHAVRVHFESDIPVHGSLSRMSYKHMTNWTSIDATCAPKTVDGRPRSHSVILSRGSDLAQNIINNSPNYISIRGLSVCGMMRVATLFKKIVIVCTGSGIAPMLDHIEFSTIPTQLIWSAHNPKETYGERICCIVKSRLPDANIHNTSTHGTPDLIRMSYNMAKDFHAEAVLVISNQKITKKLVNGLETRGVVTYGAVWDN